MASAAALQSKGPAADVQNEEFPPVRYYDVATVAPACCARQRDAARHVARGSPTLLQAGKIIRRNVVLPVEDSCEGRWAPAVGQQLRLTNGSLISQYSSTYPNGFALFTSGGQIPGRAIAVCAR